jgi:integrase
MGTTTEKKEQEQSKRGRGGGSIYKQKYRTADGELRESRFWAIKYYKHGMPFRENSHSQKWVVAERLLRKRLGEIGAGVFVSPAAERLRYKDLRVALFADYRANGRKSLLKHADGTEYICGVSALDEFFAGSRAVEITTPRIREFIAQRQRRDLPNATINRSLALLRRMFRLALQDGSLRVVPHFPMLKENNVRKGFVVHDQYTLLRDALPDYLKPVLAMGYFTGMREGEILPLRLDQLSIRDSQVLLDPGATKNDQPRIVPLTGELRAILEMQLDRHQRECPHCRFLFFYRGRKIGVFRRAWRNTCVRVGLGRYICDHCGNPTVGTKQCAPCSKLGKQNKRRYEGLLFHDLRRTGVRNLVRAGAPERIAMDVSGHKTRAVFDRYNIVNERDLRDAAEKLSRYLSAEFGHSSGIGSILKGKPESGREPNSFSGKEKDWLGDLDSNQDSQIQSLESYQLDDLPSPHKQGLFRFPCPGSTIYLTHS